MFLDLIDKFDAGYLPFGYSFGLQYQRIVISLESRLSIDSLLELSYKRLALPIRF
jgi:hypothetical protein